MLLPVFLINGPECHVSHVCRLILRVILGTVHSYPVIYLTVQANTGKPQLGDRLMKAVQLFIKWSPLPPNGVPCLQMTTVVSQSTSGRKKKGKKKRTLREMEYLALYFSNLDSSVSMCFSLLCFLSVSVYLVFQINY